MDRQQEEKQNIKNKFAVVTGASSGIGYELAKQFAQNGFDLLIAAEDDGIYDAKDDLVDIGVDVNSVQVDLSHFEGVEELYQAIQSTGREVDAIAINAGVGVSGDFVRETKLKDELNLIHLNVISSVHLAKRVFKMMLAQNHGKVLFTSSIASTTPGPYAAVYHASKAFLQFFSQAIREELKGTNITITALMPGATETNFFHRAGMEDTPIGKSEKDDPAEVAKDGFEALMAGKDHVVAGSFKNKLDATMSKFIPQTVSAEQAGKQSRPEKHH